MTWIEMFLAEEFWYAADSLWKPTDIYKRKVRAWSMMFWIVARESHSRACMVESNQNAGFEEPVFVTC